MLANYLNECQTAGENPSLSWDEKTLSSCDNRILQITQKPIVDAENTASKTVRKTRFLGDSPRDRQPIACAILGCLGAIILSHTACTEAQFIPSCGSQRVQQDQFFLSSWTFRHATYRSRSKSGIKADNVTPP
jgi:hypothetical protein